MLFSLIFTYLCLFSKALPRGEYVNLAYSIPLPWLNGNFSWSPIYWYLSILPDDNAHIFSASLLISYCTFSSTILSSYDVFNIG